MLEPNPNPGLWTWMTTGMILHDLSITSPLLFCQCTTSGNGGE